VCRERAWCVGDYLLTKITLVDFSSSPSENRRFVFRGQREGLISEIVSFRSNFNEVGQ
jgi:hypothetical protein